MKKTNNSFRLKTYGAIETQDFDFRDFDKACQYGDRWIKSGKIFGYKIFNQENNKLMHKAGETRKRCLDWDKVDSYYDKVRTS